MNEDTYKSWAERNGFPDWVLALFWIVGAFILFQITAGIVAFGLIAVKYGVSANPAELQMMMKEHLDLVFIGNSAGQILFLGLATWYFSRLHISKGDRSKFFRLQYSKDTLPNIGLTVVLIFTLQPTIWFLSWLNAMIPVPDFFTNMQNTQMEMIEDFLRGDHVLWLTLFHVALVPAICEELLYRGYVMSAFKKSWGIWPAIIISGLLFGMYHIQLSNLIPLATLGMVFAFITWTSQSIYPAIVAHFINNGGSVMVATYHPNSAFAEMTPETMPPMTAVIPSLLISSYIVYYLYQQYTRTESQKQGSHV